MVRNVLSKGSNRSRTVAIVPAAGCGRRLGTKAKKPFVLLNGKPVIAYTLDALERCSAIDAVIIASEASCVKKFRGLVNRYRFSKVSDIVVGGKTRFESVRNCLAHVGPVYDIVVIHDGVRPFVNRAVISKSVKLAREIGACIAVERETDTVKLADGRLFIKKTLDRNNIFRAQTPQVFKREIIKKAYSIKGGAMTTDDASLVERLGVPIKMLIGEPCNLKITTKDDIKLADALLKKTIRSDY